MNSQESIVRENLYVYNITVYYSVIGRAVCRLRADCFYHCAAVRSVKLSFQSLVQRARPTLNIFMQFALCEMLQVVTILSYTNCTY